MNFDYLMDLGRRAGYDQEDLHELIPAYTILVPFSADGNIFESGQEIDEELHTFIRKIVEVAMQDVFQLMLIVEDENTKETPKRLAKLWLGDSLQCDTELGGGRFSKPIRLPKFPTDGKSSWIEKRVRVISTCSHHLLPFTGEAIIRYKPNRFVLGISKLQRLTNYVANRFYLQEDLTKALHEAIREAAEVGYDDVQVKIVAKHGCEMHRGVKNQDCEFITEEGY